MSGGGLLGLRLMELPSLLISRMSAVLLRNALTMKAESDDKA